MSCMAGRVPRATVSVNGCAMMMKAGWEGWLDGVVRWWSVGEGRRKREKLGGGGGMMQVLGCQLSNGGRACVEGKSMGREGGPRRLFLEWAATGCGLES